MKRTHAIVISLLLGVAVLAGGLAVMRTAGVGSSSQEATVPDQVIAQKQSALDKYEASLKTALAKKPPELPALAKAPKASPAVAAAPKVVYVRAQATTTARMAGDVDPYEYENGARSDDEGGGFDD